MDVEKSDSDKSSFEDLSNLNVNELKEATPTDPNVPEIANEEEEAVMDVLGNGQLTKQILEKGKDNSRPERNDICKIEFVGKLDDGTVVEEQMDFVVQVGDVEVVQGLDMSIPLMNIGEVAEVVVDARFAYGDIGLPENNIPPGAKITYKIKLLETKNENDLENKNFSQRKEIGNKKRERGNFWFKRNEFNLAIQSYRRALEYLDETEGGISSPTLDGGLPPSNAQLQDLLEDRIKTYNNLVIAQMKISAYDTALKSVDNVLRCQPNNMKALYRKAKIYEATGDVSSAIPLLQKVATLDPDDKAVQNELSKLILKSKREARNEKDLYQKMLGHAQKLEQKGKKQQQQGQKEASKLKLWGYLMGSILIGVAGVAIYRYKYF